MNKIRKVLAGVSAACAVACFAGAFAACGAPEHVHDWGEWTEKTSADCTHAQILQRDCKDENCPGGGHEEKSGAAALGHLWDWTQKSAADCTHAKVEERTCSRAGCGEHEEKNVGTELGHDWSEWAEKTPADCTHAKVEKRDCKRTGCDGHEERNSGEPDTSNHDWGEWTEKTPADCTHAKVEKRDCKRTGCDGHEERNSGEPDTSNHDWSEWTIAELPTNYKTGKATRTCLNGCEASAEEADIILPKLTDASYEKTEDTATCGEDGFITYTYTYEGEPLSFDVDTKATGAHTVAEWTIAKEPTCGVKGIKSGHCSVCNSDVTDTIPATGKHTPTGVYDACSVCGTQPSEFDATVQGNTPTINFTVKAGEWFTIRHLFFSAGYVIYTYSGTTPVQIWYSTYGNGGVVSGTATLNNGDTFYMPSSNRGTGYMALKTNSDTDVTGKITGAWQSSAPVLPTDLEMGTQTVNASIDSDNVNTFYAFIATEDGVNNYVLYCEDADALLYKKDASDTDFAEVSLPYSFTLAKGEKISFQMLISDFESKKTSYPVTLAMGEVHEHVWGEWTAKSAADCTHAAVEQRVCTDENCPVKGVEERSVGEPLGHSMTATAATAPTCTENGQEAYWTCSVCGKLYADENGATEIAAPVAVEPTGHTTVLIIDDAAHTATNKCSVCGEDVNSYSFDNEAETTGGGTAELTSGANLIKVNRGASTAATIPHFVTFTADKTGTYTLSFTYLKSNGNQYRSGGLMVNDKRVTTGITVGRDDNKALASLTFDLNEGDVCKLNLGTVFPTDEAEAYYLLTIGFAEKA